MKQPWRSYKEMLNDPAWQIRRWQIIDRDNCECVACGATGGDFQLNVHHKIYRKGCRPWEYPDEDLVTLCRPCHETASELKIQLDEALARMRVHDMERVVVFVKRLIEERT